jgi:hypothetical protein
MLHKQPNFSIPFNKGLEPQTDVRTSSMLSIPANCKWVLHVDFTNAFNTLDRSHLFKEVRKQLPGLSAFVEWSYGSHPFLLFEENILLSRTGLHQGDPLGPLLFAVGLHPLVLHIQEEVPGLLIHAWYLDDGHLVANPSNILRALSIIETWHQHLVFA